MKNSFKNKTQTGNFTIIYNMIVNDCELSYKSKGIYLYLASKPDDWKFYLSDIVKHSKDGVDAIRNGLKELEFVGYLTRDKKNNTETGQFYIEFTIYKTKQNVGENPPMETPPMENPHVGNTTAVKSNTTNTNKNNNTNLSNTDINKTNKRKYIFPFIFNYYKSKALKNHQKHTKSMELALQKFIKQTGEGADGLKKIIDRHEVVVEKTKESKYPVKIRTFSELFGQKVHGGTELIAEQYLPGGKYFNISENKTNDEKIREEYGF